MASVKAKYLNDIVITKTVSVYQVICPNCGEKFVTHYGGTAKVTAVACDNGECLTCFNIEWTKN